MHLTGGWNTHGWTDGFPADNAVSSPPTASEAFPDINSGHSDTRPRRQPSPFEAPHNPPGDEDSKWIHRDKLAKIESEELQAAGILVPKPRAANGKQKRDRSQSRLARGVDSPDLTQPRLRNELPSVDQSMTDYVFPPRGDSKMTKETVEGDINSYLTANGTGKGGSRIPVAKTSPAPILLEQLERAPPSGRRQLDSPEGDGLSYPRPRSRSASLSVSDAPIATALGGGGARAPAKRSVTDTSPTKKNTPRKLSAASKTSVTVSSRPKTRSGPGTGKDAPSISNQSRPSTRAGDSSVTHKQPEGDPPWMLNSYKPDPRLPPDQQLLPTVARRLQQEKWEKEGKFGDVYDKNFRPLNDNELAKPPDSNHKPSEYEQEAQQPFGQWPLKLATTNKSPTLPQGSYSTMPKISDNPPVSPVTGARTPIPRYPTPAQQTKQAIEPAPEAQHDEEEKKNGCRCCIVM